jgi:hypothetical protein
MKSDVRSPNIRMHVNERINGRNLINWKVDREGVRGYKAFISQTKLQKARNISLG